MAVIHVLDKHTAELIAAGEVVERPASVVKELVENAIDAGARQITVTIEAGGVRFIEVSDDGSGIEAAYIGNAFIRHATSKIATEADLYSIHTLGFRGEALASIASVARVEVLTKTEEDEFACVYRIEGGEECGVEAAARGVGTTIRVKDLFFNTPARMKFLKKDSSEGSFVADVVNRAALSHPEIKFKFVREGKVQYVTPGDGTLRSAAYTVLGKEFARDLLEVDQTISCYRISGLVTPPRCCRASRGMQIFYINGRFVKNRTMMAALESAFKGTTMQGKFPGGILMLDMPPELVDVNVHPAKTEVRFARENDVFEAVYHAVKTALTTPGSGERKFSFLVEEKEKAAVLQPEKPTAMPAGSPAVPAHKVQVPVVAAPVVSAETVVSKPAAPAAIKPTAEEDILFVPNDRAFSWGTPQKLKMSSPMSKPAFTVPVEDTRVLDILPEEEVVPAPAAAEEQPVPLQLPVAETVTTEEKEALPLPEELAAGEGYVERKVEQTTFLPEPAVEPLLYVGEIFHTYILCERGDEICLIDKHAAHERILFEKIANDYGVVPGQLLLAPVVVHLTAEEKQALLENSELLEGVGLLVEDFGGNSVVAREVPSDVEPGNVESLVVELADKLARSGKDALSEKTEWVLHSIACRAAIKAGDRTPVMALVELAERILSGDVPPFCPHGRPCVLKITKKELEKQFGRIV